MRHIATIALTVLLSACGSSGGSGDAKPLTGWAKVRAGAEPQVAIPAEFGSPRPQPLAVDGWEDGIFISRDGLHLYAVYAPADLLSFLLVAGNDQNVATDYFRGPTFGMDMYTNPAATPAWIHGNILQASRPNRHAAFKEWHLTTMARPVWSEGAPVAQGPGGTTWDLFAYTANDHVAGAPADNYNTHIYLARNAAYDPAVQGTVIGSPVIAGDFSTEDNPHIERLNATDLVLFFDSADRTGGAGMHDIWYSLSGDDGATWSAPVAIALDSPLEEEHPHLYQDGDGLWWLYYTATNPGDSKLGIYRAQQGVPGDWDSWTGSELVVGAGNTVGVGEPSLTSDGDLSFVVVIEDTVNGTPTNRYDADPWILPHRPNASATHPGRHGRVRLASAR